MPRRKAKLFGLVLVSSLAGTVVRAPASGAQESGRAAAGTTAVAGSDEQATVGSEDPGTLPGAEPGDSQGSGETPPGEVPGGTTGVAPTPDEILARLSSESESERLAAVQALSEMGDETLVPRLAVVLAGDPSAQVRRYAVVALANLGGADAEAALLNAARTDPSEEVRRWAEEALRRMGAPAAPPPPPTQPPPETGISPSVEGDPGAYWSLEESLQALSSADATLRAAAVRRLAALASPNSVPLLVSRVRIEQNVEVRRLMVIALAMLGGDMALDAVLDAALNDPSLVVQAAAREALERLGLPVERGVVRTPATTWGAAPGGTDTVAATEETEDLLGAGDVRLGGQFQLGNLWRSWSVDVMGSSLTEED